MDKNKEKNNSLIKRKELVRLMKSGGIKRANPKCFSLLESHIKNQMETIIALLMEEMLVNGRRTLKEEDIKNVLENMKKQEVLEI